MEIKTERVKAANAFSVEGQPNLIVLRVECEDDLHHFEFPREDFIKFAQCMVACGRMLLPEVH